MFALLIIPLRVYSLCKCIINVTSNIEIEEFSSRDVYNVVSDESKLDSVSSKYVTSSSGVDFTKPSSDTNGKGVYIFSSTKDDEYPIYYYRGDVSDNHVLFGGICYRILRTTSKGGTKLIYDGLPDSENKCNNTGSDTLVANGIKYGGSGNTGNFGYSYTAGHSYKSIKITNITSSSVFAEDVSYEDGKYILNSDRYLKSDDLSTNSKELLKDHHYSCFKIDGEDCTTVNYVYMSRGGYLYYIILSGGEKIEDVINNDILNNGNGTNSTIKTYVENWFSNNLTSYMDYLEDEVYCNDRSIGSIGGWNKNNYINDGTDEENKLNFGGFVRAINGTPSLTCTNDADKFTTSTSNGNGKNTYPVGLITLDESLLAGFAWDQDDESTYLYNGNVWWSMSPTLISVGLDYIGVLHSMADNVNTTYTSGVAGGVRPVITLNNNAKIDGGNGTGDNPFTIAPLN